MNHRICSPATFKAYAQGSDMYSEHQPVIESYSQCSTIIRFKWETLKSAMIIWKHRYSIEAKKRCLMVAALHDLGCAKSALDPRWRA